MNINKANNHPSLYLNKHKNKRITNLLGTIFCVRNRQVFSSVNTFVFRNFTYLEAILTLDFSFDCVCFPVLIVLRPCSSMSTDFRYALLFSKKEKFPKATEKCPTAKIIAI